MFEMRLIQAPPQNREPIISLRFADLHEAPLANRYLLRSADLDRANLNGADLTNDDLRDANLTKARLIGTNLTEANLTGADLSGTYLNDANLRDATVTEEQLSSCKSLEGATMPNGQKYEEWLKDKEGRGKDADNADSF